LIQEKSVFHQTLDCAKTSVATNRGGIETM